MVTGHKVRLAHQKALEAKKLVLYVGGGAVISEADQQLIKLAEALNLPVVSTLMGLGAFPGHVHKNSLGMLVCTVCTKPIWRCTTPILFLCRCTF
ncbi:hypothetical protein OH492_22810 [Vibrio chagasii]|nr:hypothetical protein [Vibrio chagasii]